MSVYTLRGVHGGYRKRVPIAEAAAVTTTVVALRES